MSSDCSKEQQQTAPAATPQVLLTYRVRLVIKRAIKAAGLLWADAAGEVECDGDNEDVVGVVVPLLEEPATSPPAPAITPWSRFTNLFRRMKSRAQFPQRDWIGVIQCREEHKYQFRLIGDTPENRQRAKAVLTEIAKYDSTGSFEILVWDDEFKKEWQQ